jgi:hypothetical protein
MKLVRELDADDFAERIMRGHEENATFTRSEIYEGEPAEIFVDAEDECVDEQAG